MTIHVIFQEGPMDGQIHTYTDPPDIIEFLTGIEEDEEGVVWLQYSSYHKIRVSDPTPPMRGSTGLWQHGSDTWREAKEEGDGDAE